MSEGVLTFRLRDKVLGEDIDLDNLNLPLLSEYTHQVAAFIKGERRIDLHDIKASLKSGSLVVEVENEQGLLDDVVEDYKITLEDSDLNRIDSARALIIEEWQQEANKHPDRVYELIEGAFDQSSTKQPVITISKDSNFHKPTEIWVNVEKYVYGRVFDLGGKSKANVHLELENGSTVTVNAATKMLTEDKQNRLYQKQLLRISAEENLRTKQLRNERLISFENYHPSYDEEELESFISKGSVAWASVSNPSSWVEELRGNA